MFSIVSAIRKFRHYLIGAKFTLKTDHQLLKWLDPTRKGCAYSQRLECRALELYVYEFDTLYQPGAQNQVVTAALSCCSVNLVTLNSPVSKADLSETQKTDLDQCWRQWLITFAHRPRHATNINTFPHSCFQQLWPQLCMYDSLLCQKVKTRTLMGTNQIPYYCATVISVIFRSNFLYC